MLTTSERALTCDAVAWTHEGSRLSHDEQHAFRYEVRENGKVIGFITTDRARQHPDVKWKRSVWRDDRIEDLDGDYQTVGEAFAAF
jgi:hypothetical protein